MGLTLGRAKATEQFDQALRIARSEEEVPAEWVGAAHEVGQMASATFTPLLGTALLAKATDARIDAFSLQASTSHKGYSARSLAKNVLVPRCVSEGIDLRTRGAEPLNNSPFYKERLVHTGLNVSDRTREELEELCELLARVDFLTEDGAVQALAAFLRVRIEDGRAAAVVPIGEGTMSLGELASLAAEFTNAELEGGKRGQAMAATCLDLVHDDVRSGAINDPSVRAPGDALVYEDGSVVLAAEAKQKPVMTSEILQFADRLAAGGIGKGLYLALAPSQPDLDARALSEEIAARHGVAMSVITTVDDLVRTALVWSSRGLDDGLRRLPALLMHRLVEFDCDQAGIDSWAGYFPQDD